MRSEGLGLELVVEEGQLRLYDVETGERLLTHEESEAARRAAEAAREAVEAELARLREELARLKADEIRNTPA